ncbi:hypothetical protein DYB38_006494 [Aphanomyces astaci]|uniref:AGC-kinase C-terminal domain-containing protein n=1 Tax=Aphanomyces astaci TaxID=112090 RepID=A0A397D054_APHAT|nr:hypothetical protein DYB38_006494 [Aphanomyces astaci]
MDEPWQRTLEHLAGVQGLNKSEVRKDVKEVEQLLDNQRLHVEKHQHDKTKPAAPFTTDADDDDVALSRRRRQQHLANLYLNKPMPKKKRSRGREVMSAEEIIETLPVCRRAVRLTRTELVAAKKERLNMEDTYLKLRSSFIHELESLVQEDKDQQRVMLRIRKSVGKAAAKLMSSKRRHTALQDILMELESRGDAIETLQRQVSRLTNLLGQHEIPLDSVVVGDLVRWSNGGSGGEVVSVSKEAVEVKMESGEVVTVGVDEAQVDGTIMRSPWTDDQVAMKAKYFEKAGEWVSAETAWREIQDSEEVEEGDWDSEEEEEDDESHKRKRDKGAAKPLKKLVPFKATTLPSTPYDVPLLISPLSELPDHVAAAAAGLSNVQWMGSALPDNLVQWEAERMESLAMKGEIERLKFQLQQAEAQKKDAQNHVNVQLESINKLVSQVKILQLEKQREATAALLLVNNAPPPTTIVAKDVKAKKQPAASTDKKKKERKDSVSESAPGSPLKDADMSGVEEDTAEDEDKGVETTRRSLRSSKAPAPSPAKQPSPSAADEKKDTSEKKEEADADKNNGAKPTTRRKSSRSKATPKSPTNKTADADAVSDAEEEPAAKRRTRAFHALEKLKSQPTCKDCIKLPVALSPCSEAVEAESPAPTADGPTPMSSPTGATAKVPPIMNLSESKKKGTSVDDFEFLRVIGKGTFGKVLMVRHNKTDGIYAMKINHPFVIGLEFAFQTESKVYLVMEYQPGGELFSHLKKEGLLMEVRVMAVDWWSLGALAYEMLIGHPPFETKTKNRKELHKKILTAKLVLPKWLSSDAHSLLKSLLERNVDKRLGGGKSSMFVVRGVQALKCHPFFRTIDWIAMAQMRIPPPMVPRVTHAADTQNFDTEFTELPPTDLACGDFDGDNETFRGFSFCGRHELLEVVDDVESLVLHRTRAMSRRASKELLEYILTARLASISQIVRASVMTRHMSQQNMLFVFCAFNVIFWFGLYAYFQEKLTIHGDAPPELVVMCPQYFIYTVVAYCGSCFKRGNTKKEKSSTSEEPQGFVARQPPWHVFVCIAAATFGSYYFSFRALRHVSYLLKVLGKTCKPIPILVLGLCFGKTYPPRKYASVLLITSGAAVFFLFQAKPPSSQVDPVASSLDWAPLTGIFLLVLSLACDGLAGVLEDKYIAEFNLGPFDLMLRISALSWVGCGVLLGRDWLILWHLPLATWHLIGVIGVCGGLGQVFLFVSIAAFGSLSTSVVGTCRKMLTMLTSIYVFQHPVAPAQVVGLGCAFMGMVMSTGFKPSSSAIDMNVLAWLYHHRKLHQTNHVV